MCANETSAAEAGNTMIIIYNEKQKIRQRPVQRIKTFWQKAKEILPMYWYDHLLDEFEIDLTEFK